MNFFRLSRSDQLYKTNEQSSFILFFVFKLSRMNFKDKGVGECH